MIVSTPLLNTLNKFEIFDMPIKNPKVPDNIANMVAWYNLEANLITVNLDQIKYVLLSEREQYHCSFQLHHYCNVWSPVYHITSSKLCTVALFLKDEESRSLSETIVAPKSPLPQASHVIDSLWFAAT